MKPPDAKACAQIAAHIRGFHAGKQPTFLLVDDELPTVLEALEFCARTPDYWAIVQKESTSARVTYARETLVDCDEEMVACYRIEETEGE